jgi:phage terminase large subunit-like protein
MKLHSAQDEVARDTHRFRVLCCGRRWGKTTLAVEEIKGVALSKDARIAYIAPTFQQARDIAWQMLIKELKPITKKVNESRLELEVVNLKGGTSSIALRGWEAIETLRGQFFDFIVIDEVASMRNFNVYWHEVVRPTLTDTKGQVMFISTPKGFNHFYDLFNTKEREQA